METKKGDILEQRTFSTKQVIMLLAFFISTTFTATKIYDRFELMEKEHILEKEYVRSELEKSYNRTSKITKRNSDRIDGIEKDNKN